MNSNYLEYLDDRFANHDLNSESDRSYHIHQDNNRAMKGGRHNDSISSSDILESSIGGVNANNYPSGGFPPLYECNKEETISKITQKKKPTREYSTKKQFVSIKNIMEKRRENEPFIPIG